MSVVVAAVLFTGVLLYALLGGADFGAGFWDLTAGGVHSGTGPRRLIDRSLGPVWEADHVWLIFCLVVLWTAFPPAFAAITTTLYVPLGLAALGIVVRAAGFAFREVLVRTPEQRVAGALFAVSSVVTPFFLGAAVGGVASGRVPAAGGGDPLASWVNPTAVLGGTLAVTASAYLAAVSLAAFARERREPELEAYFRRRAVASAVVAGVLTFGGIAVLHADAPRLADRLLGPVLPLVVLSAAAGVAALGLLARPASARAVRAIAATAVGAVVAGWGAAQYPYLLGTHVTIAAAASPRPTLVSVAVVFGVAVVLVVPSLALLYVLAHRGELEGV
ncbi:MAG: cytochrome d ubiquinol oxidase subunit [Mycobacterium sp.]|nr:cytochrome d ubiquinol oxidase subunit [Mycobacterium sp.]